MTAASQERRQVNNKKWYEANKDYYRDYRAKHRDKQNDSNLKKRYGITAAQRDDLLASQDFRCAICQTDDPQGRHGTWHVDHCHETKVVRGLLCNHCNLLLGHARDNKDVLARAITYLSQTKGT